MNSVATLASGADEPDESHCAEITTRITLPAIYPFLGLANSMLTAILLILQALQVAFLWVHDWVPVGRLNDVPAVRKQDTVQRLAAVTLIQSLPFTVILILSAVYFGQPYPHWLITSIWIAYVILLLGQLRAWWVPYLFRPEPERAARYRAMFGNTHSFLPVRNGLVPNTAHIFLHVCTAATLFVLFVM